MSLSFSNSERFMKHLMNIKLQLKDNIDNGKYETLGTDFNNDVREMSRYFILMKDSSKDMQNINQELDLQRKLFTRLNTISAFNMSGDNANAEAANELCDKLINLFKH